MAERYTKLFSNMTPRYVTGAPLILEAGALLKDNATKNTIIQLKFKAIQNGISAVFVLIDAFDYSKETVISNFEFVYNDLNISRDEEFGSKTPIIITAENIRSFTIRLAKVQFTDQTEWYPSEEIVDFPKAVNLRTVLSEQDLQLYKELFGADKEYMPFEFNDLWVCSCGHINKENESTCHSCGKEKEELFVALDRNYLIYTKALTLKATGTEESLTEASELFESVAEYLDSAELQNECLKEFEEKKNNRIYEVALNYENEKSIKGYEKAIAELSEIPDWKDSSERIKNNESIVLDLKKKEKKKKTLGIIIAVAVLCLLAILFGPSLREYIEYGRIYAEAEKYLQEENYESAINQFNSISEYKDAADRAKEACYKLAVKYLEESKLTAARKYFDLAQDFLDAREKWKETQYLIGKNYYDNEQWEAAFKELNNCIDYKDSQKLVNISNVKIIENEFKRYGYDISDISLEKLDTLVKENTAGSKDLYNRIYSNVVKMALSDKEYKTDAGFANAPSSISVYSTLYCNVAISGMDYSKKGVSLHAKIIYPDGQVKNEDWDTWFPWVDSNTGNFQSYSYCWEKGIWQDPSLGAIGTFTIELYDDNGKLLALDSIRITR